MCARFLWTHKNNHNVTTTNELQNHKTLGALFSFCSFCFRHARNYLKLSFSDCDIALHLSPICLANALMSGCFPCSFIFRRCSLEKLINAEGLRFFRSFWGFFSSFSLFSLSFLLLCCRCFTDPDDEEADEEEEERDEPKVSDDSEEALRPRCRRPRLLLRLRLLSPPRAMRLSLSDARLNRALWAAGPRDDRDDDRDDGRDEGLLADGEGEERREDDFEEEEFLFLLFRLVDFVLVVLPSVRSSSSLRTILLSSVCSVSVSVVVVSSLDPVLSPSSFLFLFSCSSDLWFLIHS